MGLRVSIYTPSYGECSNGGYSARFNDLTIVNVDGPFNPTAAAPAALLVAGNLPNTARVVPADSPTGMVGPMMGGCYVASCDGRWADAVIALTGTRTGAVALHDRYESQATYNALSA